MTALLNDIDLIERIFSHIDAGTTDAGERVWREPVENYLCEKRFAAEIEVLRRVPVPFCPSAAIREAGDYVARRAALTPLIVVRGEDGIARGFRNACRHRGMQVAEGSGRTRAFVCPYHSWAYGLDGCLKHIPGAAGFPDLNPDEHGLVPVKVEEKGGLVFVTQDEPLSEGALEGLPQLFDDDQQMFDSGEVFDEANWKLIGETSMEGYHIKSLHNKTFYPYGFDNLNVVETYGANSRVVFPFRRIEKLRDKPKSQWRLDGMVTDVHQLFPNTHISVLSNHSMLIVLEPLSPTRTQWVIYRVQNKGEAAAKLTVEQARRDAGFVNDTGLLEDRQAATSIQESLAGKGNSHFTFGHFEQAAVHFHEVLDRHVAMLAAA